MFGDRLKFALKLVIGGDTFSLPAGSIKHIDVALTFYGFDAEASFFVSSEEEADAIFPRFTTSDLITATLSIANGRAVFAAAAAHPLVITGHVTEKRMREVVGRRVSGEPIVGRRYVVKFADPAQALWRQHRPLELYVNTSMRQVIDLHKAQGMRLSYDWAKLDEVLDVLCVGLGGEQEASFYDFVAWYIHENHGVLELDPATGSYRIGKTKSRGGQSLMLEPEAVEEIRVLPPEPVRYATTVLNPCTEAAVLQKPLSNDQAAPGVRVGAFAHTLVASRFDERVQIETERLVPGEHGLEVIYKACPEALKPPGQLMSLGDEFSRQMYASGKKYRVIEVNLRAREKHDGDGEQDLEAETAAYDIELRSRLELESDPTPRLPLFRRPSYPVMAEGRVLSVRGQEEDRTFHALEGESDSLYRYRINIPLWDKIVVAPFVPGGLTGHFFFPAYKNQRVLVALDFDSARISSFLEWAGKLPRDTQGDQLVLGWNDHSETIVRHVYEDNRPVLQVARRLDSDTETVALSEGTVFMQVKEE